MIMSSRGEFIMPRIIPCLLLLGLCFSSCTSTTKRPVAEAPPPVYQPTPESKPVQLTVAAAPKLSEVQEAVKRVFKDAAVIDTKYNPSFVTGDFNGDDSQDLAVILKPVNLDLMNQELPPWLVREPRSEKRAPQPAKITKDDVLLAVIHGYGPNHWRDPDATQAFVLKDVVGSDLKVHNPQDFVAANSGRKLPRAQGDLIGETVAGTPGYLYYASSTYSWYDPETFKGDAAPPGMFHKQRTR
jgi:hypothetical protein